MTPEAAEDLQRTVGKMSRKLDRLVALARVAALPDDQVLMFNHRGRLVRLYLPGAATEGVQGMILRDGDFFEADLLNRIRELRVIDRSATVFDIGANIGNHTVYFAKILGAARVHAFEPQEYCVHVLKENLSLNGIGSVQVHDFGVGARTGPALLDRFKRSNHGAASFSPSEDGDIQLVSMDDFMREQRIDALSFVKIDVEGHAADVIDGAQETLAEFKPVIWAELLPRFGEAEPVLERLQAQGYEVAEKLSRVDFLLHHRARRIGG